MRNSTVVRMWMTACLVLACALCLAQEAPYGVGSWDESLGSQRARLSVDAGTDAVRARIPWRRADANPQRRGIAIVDSASGKPVQNIIFVDINREFGEIVFQAGSSGVYDVYYMLPDKRTPNPDPKWLENYPITKLRGSDPLPLPEARVTEFQARTELDRRDPMEVIATCKEVDDLLVRNPLKSMFFFPEDRRYPIRMADYLPQRWAPSGPSTEFKGEAARGEYYTFQVGIYAARTAIDSADPSQLEVRVGFGDLRSAAGDVISSELFTCHSLGGLDRLGRPMARGFKVGLGKVRPLWFGVQVPEDVPPGDYTGTVAIKVIGAPETAIKITLSVTDKVLKDAGDSDPARLSRLWWLDSRIGIDDDVIAPYTAIKVSSAELSLLGRSIRFGKTGLPESIKSGGREVLARPMDMIVETGNGLSVLVGASAKTLQDDPGRVAREYSASSDILTMKCLAVTDLDGCVNFTYLLKAKKDAAVEDIRLEVPMKRDVAVYLMGLGRRGGLRPREWHWKWDVNRANNTAWVGDVDAGLGLKLKGAGDTWEGDDLKASGLPVSWSNEGRGGCDVIETADCALVRAYSGERMLKEGDEVVFRFGLLVTPVKPLDPSSHWSRRCAQGYVPLGELASSGANVVNIPYGNELNPYLNYPFLTAGKLLDYVEDAHGSRAKVNLGCNVGELSNHCPELWVLRSLGSEVIADGPGGGHAWLQEHLISNYKPGPVRRISGTDTDVTLASSPHSRRDNYYIEGLAWLVQSTRIDGLYLDGVGFDRETMKRVYKVMGAAVARPVIATGDATASRVTPVWDEPPLDLSQPKKTEPRVPAPVGCLIDLHAAADPSDRVPRISPLCRYMEHLPYVTSMRIDGVRPDDTPDFWLTELSGIPFGLVGDAPEGAANPWRAMVFGMAPRAGSTDDPGPIWKLWDDFGIAGSKMIGYWSTACPVKTGNVDVPATVYTKKGRALIAIANWLREPVRVRLAIDWQALGLDTRKADLTAPAIPGIQDARDLQWSGEILIDPGKGLLLVLAEK